MVAVKEDFYVKTSGNGSVAKPVGEAYYRPISKPGGDKHLPGRPSNPGGDYGKVPGVGTAGTITISMSKPELENLVSKLNNARQEMESIWNDVRNNDIQKISGSWAGADCAKYMEKINYLEMSKSFEALTLLANAYTKAIAKVEELQTENINIIESL